jgi:hypothetical protein|tara:strand:- start:1676 stop:2212 length:537 start_codon:yes stop_codon:yes gene_type:complete
MKLDDETKAKAESCWDKNQLLADEIDVKKTTKKEFLHALKNCERLMQDQKRRLDFQDAAYMELWTDAYKLKQAYEKQTKELEVAYKDRNTAIRRYNALHQLGKLAKSEGIDLTKKLPENQKNKYKFSLETKVLESGRSTWTATLKPKRSQPNGDYRKKKLSSNGQDITSNNKKDKKKV